MIKITSPVTIKGTTIELTDVILRIGYLAPDNGKSIQVYFNIYQSLDTYVNNVNNKIEINEIECQTRYYSLAKGTDPETYDEQSLSIAHSKVKEYLETLGFTVEIINI